MKNVKVGLTIKKEFFKVILNYILPIAIILSSFFVFDRVEHKNSATYLTLFTGVIIGVGIFLLSLVQRGSKIDSNITGEVSIPDQKDNGNLGHVLSSGTNNSVKVKIKKLTPEAIIPSYAKSGDAGLDLTAISCAFNGLHLYQEFGTGLSIEIPDGFVGLIFPRSSISDRSFALSNAVGVIDSGYRGEIKLRFKADGNVSTLFVDKKANPFLEAETRDYKLSPYKVGDKVAQLVILPYPQIQFEEVSDLSKTERGEGGYGHTGK